MVRWSVIFSLVALNLLYGVPPFIAEGGVKAAFLYPFFHANWFHLLVNGIAIWTLYRPEHPCKPCRDLLFPYMISCVVWPLSARPLVGISNMLYAAIGLRTPPFSSRWWRSPSVIFFLIATILTLLIPRFAGLTHIVSFTAGVLLAALHRQWLDFTKDARRYY